MILGNGKKPYSIYLSLSKLLNNFEMAVKGKIVYNHDFLSKKSHLYKRCKGIGRSYNIFLLLIMQYFFQGSLIACFKLLVFTVLGSNRGMLINANAHEIYDKTQGGNPFLVKNILDND